MGHEFMGVVEDVGSAVRTVKRGDVVVAPFAISDGTRDFCREGLQTSCEHGAWWGGTENDGGQGEAVRVPLAGGTLVALPIGADHALMPSLPVRRTGARPRSDLVIAPRSPARAQAFDSRRLAA